MAGEGIRYGEDVTNLIIARRSRVVAAIAGVSHSEKDGSSLTILNGLLKPPLLVEELRLALLQSRGRGSRGAREQFQCQFLWQAAKERARGIAHTITRWMQSRCTGGGQYIEVRGLPERGRAVVRRPSFQDHPLPPSPSHFNFNLSKPTSERTWRCSIFCFFLIRVIFAWWRFLSRDRMSRSSAVMRLRLVFPPPELRLSLLLPTESSGSASSWFGSVTVAMSWLTPLPYSPAASSNSGSSRPLCGKGATSSG